MIFEKSAGLGLINHSKELVRLNSERVLYSSREVVKSEVNTTVKWKLKIVYAGDTKNKNNG